jgi:arsenite methyltransferase
MADEMTGRNPSDGSVQAAGEERAALVEHVRARYAGTARAVLEATSGARDARAPLPVVVSCCGETASAGNGCCGDASAADGLAAAKDPVSAGLYDDAETAGLPLAARLASLGCGNPTALAELHAGERVLDLGSGGGIDVLLSARRVGPTGFVYGLDMTDEMLELAERNRAEAGIENARFLKGQIEAIPLPEASVDVVISNCVINLSADKGQVLREAFRVLAPGGRFAVSDIVVQGQMPAALRANMEAWAGCVAGALEEDEYRALLAEAGFTGIEVEVTRRYQVEDVLPEASDLAATLAPADLADAAGRFVSAFVRARKPGGASAD